MSLGTYEPTHFKSYSSGNEKLRKYPISLEPRSLHT